jgi:hypothetical protein
MNSTKFGLLKHVSILHLKNSTLKSQVETTNFIQKIIDIMEIIFPGLILLGKELDHTQIGTSLKIKSMVLI